MINDYNFCYAFTILGLGIIYLVVGWKSLILRNPILAPGDLIAIWLVRVFKGADAALLRKEALYSKKTQNYYGWSSLVMGLILTIVAIIVLVWMFSVL